MKELELSKEKKIKEYSSQLRLRRALDHQDSSNLFKNNCDNIQILCENLKNKTYFNENAKIALSTLLEVGNFKILDNVKGSKFTKLIYRYKESDIGKEIIISIFNYQLSNKSKIHMKILKKSLT